jgi:signal transduction histidine kinase
MARSDMETLSMVHQRVDLSEPLADALSQALALAGERHIQIDAQAMPAGAVIVMGDAQRLCQLLLLLLDNAVRYSHPAGCVSLRWWRSDEPNPSLVLQVIDQGIGIPAEELHQVFDRHFRGRMARLHRAAGSGLGLPIAKALAQAHGGTLTLESPADEATGTGTRVQLRLPLLHWEPTSAHSDPQAS